MVIWIVLCPSSSCTAFRGTPRITKCDANVCLSTCQPNQPETSLLAAALKGYITTTVDVPPAIRLAEDEFISDDKTRVRRLNETAAR